MISALTSRPRSRVAFKRREDRLDLHLVDRREEDPEPHPAGAEHRVDLLQRPHPGEVAFQRRARRRYPPPQRRAAALRRRGARAGTRGAAGRAGGSSPAARPSRRRSLRSPPAAAAADLARPARRPSSVSARITATIASLRSAPKNMCSVRQRPIPSAPNSRARWASSGVSALVRTPSDARLVGPLQDRLEGGAHVGLDQRHVVRGHRAGRAVDRDPVPGPQDDLAGAAGPRPPRGRFPATPRRSPRGRPYRGRRAPRARPCRPPR